MLLMGKRKAIDSNLYIFKPLVALSAFRMGHLQCLGQGDRLFGMAGGARSLLPPMTFEARLFRRPKSGRVMGIVINVVVTGGAGVLQLLNMEPVGN